MTETQAPARLQRLPDWQARFAAFIQARLALPFAWGTNDCATFAADGVLAITGVDVAPPVLRLHRSAAEALHQLLAHKGLFAIATAALGEPIPALMARVGDVVLLTVADADGRQCLGLCNGTTAMGPTQRGAEHVAMSQALAAWQVG
jgi:hypothetical protein